MKVTLTNGETLQVQGIHGRNVNYQGVQRDSLIFLFHPETVPLEKALTAFTPERCALVTVEDDNGETFIHENYTIRLEAGIGYRDMILAGGVDGQTMELSVYVRMAQSTLAERMLQNQQEAIDALLIAALQEGL